MTPRAAAGGGRGVVAWAPGRTELAGNHTDHQQGRAIAAAVRQGTSMRIRANGADAANVESAGFAPVSVDVRDVSPRASERSTTAALVRGVVAGLRERGVAVAGFDAQVESRIAPGSGLSSSAAFEMALVQGLSLLFAGGRMDPLEAAHVGRRAECGWFGKPCGLLDQAASALGGVTLLDFEGGGCAYERIGCDFEAAGYAVCLVDVHCDHSRYAGEYAQVAHDMTAVAHFMGAEALRQVGEGRLAARLDEARRALGDLPVLRALHYYNEMDLVDARAEALARGDYARFVELARRSGSSSAMFLQNVSAPSRADQPAMVALALAERLLGGRGAARIHGGGFGGTVQAVVPLDVLEPFRAEIDAQLGEGSCTFCRISDEGAHARWE